MLIGQGIIALLSIGLILYSIALWRNPEFLAKGPDRLIWGKMSQSELSVAARLFGGFGLVIGATMLYVAVTM